MLTDDLTRRITKQQFGPAIPFLDAIVVVYKNNRVRRICSDRREMALLGAGLMLSLFFGLEMASQPLERKKDHQRAKETEEEKLDGGAQPRGHAVCKDK